MDFAIVHDIPEADFEDAVSRTTDALAEEGFGVLTEIDVWATLKKKLDVDFRRYVILGACNPELAHRALEADPFIGVLLPCNVVVMERDGGGSTVAAFKPAAGFSLIGNTSLEPLAAEVEERMTRALAKVAGLR